MPILQSIPFATWNQSLTPQPHLLAAARIADLPLFQGLRVHTEGRGGTLADVPFFAGGVLPGTAIAAERSICAVFPREALRAAIAANPDVAFALLARLALRVRELVGRLDQVSSKSVAARLATYLLRRSSERQTTDVSLGMTQSQLAEELGTVREVIVRELRELRRKNVIRPSRGGGVEILDVGQLSERAGTLR